MMRPVRAVLFDLDGTLLNTLSDIAHAMNTVLSEHGLPVHDPDDYRSMVGLGLDVLVRLALPAERREDERLVDELSREWLREYARDPVARTRPYDGIVPLVDELRRRGIVVGVLSNKADELVRRSVDELFGPDRFAAVWGKRDGFPTKPDPASALAVAREIGAEPGEVVYIGDSDVDMETAHRAGMVPVGAAWGFRGADELREAGAARIVFEPLELIDVVEESEHVASYES
ncbi:MAG: HAD family hydrolase [Spirochaetota bacterium]